MKKEIRTEKEPKTQQTKKVRAIRKSKPDVVANPSWMSITSK
jgi:hypothetical protein